MKVRNGPFDREHNFTTMIIVINRIKVIKINVYILCEVNILISWCDFVNVSVVFRSIVNSVIRSIVNVIDIVMIIFFVDIFCWFGDVAVK